MQFNSNLQDTNNSICNAKEVEALQQQIANNTASIKSLKEEIKDLTIDRDSYKDRYSNLLRKFDALMELALHHSRRP